MSRVRNFGVVAVATIVLVTGVACSKSDDGGDAGTSGRAPVEFADPPEGSTSLGLCHAYPVANVKKLLGGTSSFRRLAPAPIGRKGDPVTGERCAFERDEANGDLRTLTIEVRDYGADTAALTDSFTLLRGAMTDPKPISGVGDEAVGAQTKDLAVVYARQGQYELRVVSRSDGDLDPVPVDTLTFLAGQGLGILP
jgi:hypothetical protein